MEELQRLSYAPNTTLEQYDRHWYKWRYFCQRWKDRFGRSIRPSEFAFKDYALWRFNNPTRKKRITGSSIRTEISGINSYLCNLGFKLEIAKMRSFKSLCKGMDIAVINENGTRAPRSKRRAMVNSMLDPMILALDNHDWDMLVAKAALAMGKAAGFRPDNYLCCQNRRYFRISDITWLPRATHTCTRVILTFDASKTNQFRRSEQRCIDCRCPAPCAVHLLWDICRLRLNRPYEPILLKKNGSRFKYQDMIRVLDSLCYEFFLDRKYYTPYCLRVGAACEDWWRGVSKMDIMAKYGWASQSSCDRYLRETNVDLVRFLPCNVPLPSRKP